MEDLAQNIGLFLLVFLLTFWQFLAYLGYNLCLLIMISYCLLMGVFIFA